MSINTADLKARLSSATSDLKSKVELSTDQFRMKANEMKDKAMNYSESHSLWNIFSINGEPLKYLVKLVIVIIMVSLILHSILFQYSDWFNNKKDETVTRWDTFVDSVYFTFSTYSTVGYGDLLPANWKGKALITFEQMLVLYMMLSTL